MKQLAKQRLSLFLALALHYSFVGDVLTACLHLSLRVKMENAILFEGLPVGARVVIKLLFLPNKVLETEGSLNVGAE